MKRSVAASIAKRSVKKIRNDWSSYSGIQVINDWVKIILIYDHLNELALDEARNFAQDVMDDIPVGKRSQSWYSEHVEMRGTLTAYKAGVKRKVLEEIKKIIGD